MRMVGAETTVRLSMSLSMPAFSGGTPQIQSTPPVTTSAIWVSGSLMVR